jgi:metallophosphoesterase (TIGR00282 family)
MKILFVGDIVGRPGRRALKSLLPNVVDRYKIDFVIANGENAAGGFGITDRAATEIFECGVHAITSGNHVWDKKEAVGYLAREARVLRPLNYPPGVPGAGSLVHDLDMGVKVAVVNISGRVFMQGMDCPFRAADEEISRLKQITPNIIVDFHAEATSEKIAFGYYLDGRVSAVLGTHTHVQTADERVLDGGTAYITDVGMTGPVESVIGVDRDIVIERFLTHIPLRFEVAKGKTMLSAVVVEINGQTGKASAITRLQLTPS